MKTLSETRIERMNDQDVDRPALPTPVRAPEDAGPAPDELLVPHEARALIRASSARAATGLRNRALVAAMYRSGLRPGEVLALTIRDVDLEAGTVAVPARKGGRPRVTGLDAPTRELIAAWLERRAERRIPAERTLFCTLAGEPLKAAYVRELLPRLARKAGIHKRVHPLALRYANAAELAEEGMPAAMIDLHLGVAPAGGARRYRRPVSQDEVVAAIAARRWRL
jgi:integrase/recombinase XerD